MASGDGVLRLQPPSFRSLILPGCTQSEFDFKQTCLGLTDQSSNSIRVLHTHGDPLRRLAELTS